MVLKQLSEMTGHLLAADSLVVTQEARDTIQSMLIRWKNSYDIDPADDANLEEMAAKIYLYIQATEEVSRELWHAFKLEQGWIAE